MCCRRFFLHIPGGLTRDGPEQGPGSGPGLSPGPGVVSAHVWGGHSSVQPGRMPQGKAVASPSSCPAWSPTQGRTLQWLSEDGEAGSCPTFRTHPLRTLSHLTSQLGFLPLQSRESQNSVSQSSCEDESK